MSIEYLDLADFIAIAAEVTGLDEDTIAKIADLGLADSALHPPQLSAIANCTRTSSTRPHSLSRNSHATILSLMATSAPHGFRCACSSRSTIGRGHDDLASTTRKSSSCRSPPASWTNKEQPRGFAPISSHPNRCERLGNMQVADRAGDHQPLNLRRPFEDRVAHCGTDVEYAHIR